jgi:hypothetical protein
MPGLNTYVSTLFHTQTRHSFPDMDDVKMIYLAMLHYGPGNVLYGLLVKSMEFDRLPSHKATHVLITMAIYIGTRCTYVCTCTARFTRLAKLQLLQYRPKKRQIHRSMSRSCKVSSSLQQSINNSFPQQHYVRRILSGHFVDGSRMCMLC